MFGETVTFGRTGRVVDVVREESLVAGDTPATWLVLTVTILDGTGTAT